MLNAVNVVVTCTKRKALPVHSGLALRAHTGSSPWDLARRWIERLEGAPAQLPARDLYQGDHWSVVRSMPEAAAKGQLRAKIWVLSAGYGLVDWLTPLASYSATFSPDHPDSVAVHGERWDSAIGGTRLDWWHALSAWSGPVKGSPRTLAKLAEDEPQTPALVVASSVYLAAVRDDLTRMRDRLETPELLSIVSAGAEGLGALTGHLIPADARFRGLLGGGMNSLNSRVARKILAEAGRWPVRNSVLKKRYGRLLAKQDALEAYDRVPLSDAQVRRFVEVALRADPTVKKTPLLRRLRDGGQACEQKRFGALFKEVRAQFLEATSKEAVHGA